MSRFSAELTFAHQLADHADRLTLQAFRAGPEHRSKADGTWVTRTDEQVERLVRDHLREAFPEHAVLGEEQGLEGAPDAPRWIVDPIDGTTNFLKGLSGWGVSLGLVDAHDRALVGVVDMPTRGELYVAAAGLGATRNGLPISCSAVTRLDRTLMCYALPRRRDTAWGNAVDSLAALLRVAGQTLGTRMQGCAVADLTAVATGTIDAMWSGGMSTWDVAAGLLVAIEAGAMVTDPAGDQVDTVQTAFLASPPAVHDALRALLAGPG